MTTANPADINTSDITGAQVTSAQSQVGKFDDILAASSYAAQVGGGAVISYADQTTSPTGAEAISAMVNSVGNYSSGTATTYMGGLSTSTGTMSGLSTSTSMLGTSTDDAMSVAQSTLEQGQVFSVNMLILQQEVQQQGLSTGLISNVFKAQSDRDASIMNNIRGVA